MLSDALVNNSRAPRVGRLDRFLSRQKGWYRVWPSYMSSYDQRGVVVETSCPLQNIPHRHTFYLPQIHRLTITISSMPSPLQTP